MMQTWPMAGTGEELRVEAGAEKRFFIEMLTKDIELIPALVDLVDNSVDGARSIRGPGERLDGQWVRITANSELCRVADNSGGIELGLARQYAFRFGRPEAFKGTKRSVGQFGIGMKRAMFKIGEKFCVESTFQAQGEKSTQFMLEVDVDAWARNPAWHFVLTNASSDYELGDGEEAGTTIEITGLHPSAGDDFASTLVMSDLSNELQVRHQEAIQAGLRIELNGKVLTAAQPSLQFSDAIRPIHRRFTVDTPKGSVEVALMAGTVRAQRRGSEGPLDDGDAESFPTPGNAGWYLFCNDRLLVSADRSTLTGWGDPAAAYHPQYRLFRGYAYLYADDAALLPWNTTKTAVDRDSQVFRRVQSEMKTALIEVQATINRLKTDVERRKEEESPPTNLETAFDEAREVGLKDLPETDQLVAPPAPPQTKPRRSRSKEQRISYLVGKDVFASVMEDLGASSAADVGRSTFEYYLDNELTP